MGTRGRRYLCRRFVCARRWGMGRRHELTETEWARLAPLLPPRQAGKPRKDDRLVINGILWKLATGAPWRDLPERFGPWQRVYTRCRRWRRAGVWDGMLAAVQQQADAAGAQGGTRRRRRWGAARAATPPRSISARRAAASR